MVSCESGSASIMYAVTLVVQSVHGWVGEGGTFEGPRERGSLQFAGGGGSWEGNWLLFAVDMILLKFMLEFGSMSKEKVET